MVMNFQDLNLEIKTWSTSVLQTLVDEEDLSTEYRWIMSAELNSRPQEQTVILTPEAIHQAATDGYSGWTKVQLAALGISWPPPKGWLRKMAGKPVPMKNWLKFLALKGKKQNPVSAQS